MFLTNGYRFRAVILEKTGRYDEAERAYRKGLDVALAVVADGPPRDQYLIWPIGEYFAFLGELLLKVGRADEAARLIDLLGEETFENAGSWVWQMMAGTYSQLGFLLSRTDQPRAEERAWRRLILLNERIARAEPRVPRHDRELARWHKHLADLLRRGGAPERPRSTNGGRRRRVGAGERGSRAC